MNHSTHRKGEKKSLLLTMRAGNNYINGKGGCGPLVSNELSLTLSCANSQILFVTKKTKKRKTK